jgi:hypothetical protein
VTTGLIARSAKALSRDDIISESNAHREYVEAMVQQDMIH